MGRSLAEIKKLEPERIFIVWHCSQLFLVRDVFKNFFAKKRDKEVCSCYYTKQEHYCKDQISIEGNATCSILLEVAKL